DYYKPEVTLYLDDVAVYASGLLDGPDVTPFQFVAPAGIEFDEFKINQTAFGDNTGTYFASDDIGFTTSAVEAVPEPVSLAALGMGGLALLRRRRKSA
ncbi:PEP-CTERM sorting domain-containing protein, partial [bacterium]